MQSLTISGSDSRFLFPTTSMSMPDPKPSVAFFPAHISKPIFSTRVSPGSVKAKAAVNDGLVAEVAEAAELSFYELLGISESGSLVEIKQAYKQLARKYHPDVSPPDRVKEYTRRFIRVQEAYETLSDPRRRAMYDRDMAKGIHLAFSAGRRRYQNDEGMDEKGEWKSRWQAQVSELKRRSMNKDSKGSMSWGARMRRQREESCNGL
ncbi:hypothetical protein FNV43_RR01282 [Rhamnella rubrinervis]|uniref:J domain-containing protein n=1 Tax=Rhamnella rubrinervis TaxID=2594499 RepID=A0A8K0HS62_9ROSA|nr:hypothetical protein FNV43_RR01282 [Rhamnella rubrinervis]